VDHAPQGQHQGARIGCAVTVTFRVVPAPYYDNEFLEAAETFR